MQTNWVYEKLAIFQLSLQPKVRGIRRLRVLQDVCEHLFQPFWRNLKIWPHMVQLGMSEQQLDGFHVGTLLNQP